MKVLLTGCSAPQSSSSLNSRVPTFSGLIRNALSYAGHTVTWESPSMFMDEDYLSEFDVVIVGLTPPTSVSSYRLYGALSVIERARRVTNVRYLVDAPEPHKLWASIRALANNPKDLVKDFYQKRPEFENVVNNSDELDRLHSVLVDLYENQWEKTLVPAFPWSQKTNITSYIPNLSEDSVELLCLDSFLLTAVWGDSSVYMKQESDFWVTNQKTPWVESLEKTLHNRVEPLVMSKKFDNSQVLVRMNKSIGTVISTYKNDDPWWSVNLSQSLFVNTPVVTDWKHTNYLGNSWSILAHQIEEMPFQERSSLASRQKNEYIKVLPNFEDAVSGVLLAIFDSKDVESNRLEVV
jgi:hypothetical protein